jgi:haloacetate dehalogenase
VNVIADRFPGFAEHRIPTEGAEIFVRTGGSSPLLLLHGYPQTHVCWHKIAAELAGCVTLMLADLRGYGASSAPPGDARGGRVAYRLAADHPDAIWAPIAIAIAILATAEVWRRSTPERALAGYHWAFPAQPLPLPETPIGRAPTHYLEHTLKSWAGSGDLSQFSSEALARDRALLKEPARVHAVCEDCRAGAGIDRRLDEADLGAGRRIACPTFVLWGSEYLGRGGANPLDVWRTWCTETGAAVKVGHFLAEENPQPLAALGQFRKAHAGNS